MSFHRKQYLQAAANRCAQFADEGACLARLSRIAPVTVVPGFGGLGQATLGTTTLAPRSSQLIAVQQALISAGLLALRAPDGVISATSPTLSALQQWATNNGYSASGAARTSSGGLVIPNELFAAILTQRTAPRSGSTPSSPPTSVPSGGGYVKDTSASPSPATTMPVSTLPGWLPWAIGISVTALGVGALVRFSR